MMAEVSKSLNIPQIDKLCGAKNYHTWRSIAMTLLDIMRVGDDVTGKTPKPDSTDATAGAYGCVYPIARKVSSSVISTVALCH